MDLDVGLPTTLRNRRKHSKLQFAPPTYPSQAWSTANMDAKEERLMTSPYVITHRERPQSTYKTDFSNYMPRISLTPIATSPITRYTSEEWLASNLRHFNLSENTRAEAETMRSQAQRIIRETEQKTKLAQSESGRRLGERIHDIKFWKEELHIETNKLSTEIAQLEELKKNLKRAFAETETPLQAAQECLLSREGRQGIDLVHDQVQESLICEARVIKRCQNQLNEAIRNVDTQLQRMREARWLLESDEGKKFTALNIDQISHRLHNHSRGIYFYNEIEKDDPSTSVPETWAEFSQRNIQRSQRERMNSQHLRGEYHTLINVSTEDMHRSWEKSNLSLNVRVTETTDARNKLQDHYAKVVQELYDVDRQIAAIKRSLQDKLPPLKVAQTRLENRTHRPEMELCRDPPHNRLVLEVRELQNSIDALNKQLEAAEKSQQSLLRTKSQLESDLKVKTNSIVIDREKCLGIRRSFPVTSLVPQFP